MSITKVGSRIAAKNFVSNLTHFTFHVKFIHSNLYADTTQSKYVNKQYDLSVNFTWHYFNTKKWRIQITEEKYCNS